MTELATRKAEDDRDLKSILDAMPTPVALFDREHNCRYANRRYLALMGKSAGQVVGHRVAEILGAEIWSQLAPHAERAASGHEARFEAWETHDDGHRCYLQRTYVPLVSASGETDGYYVVIHDLTDLTLREEELEAQRSALRGAEAVNAAVVASALDCVVVIDAEARVVSFNPMAEQTFGYRQADVIGRPISELIVPPHLRSQHSAGFERYLKTGNGNVIGRRVEVEAMRADHSIIPVELAITEVSLPGRRLFTAYLRDLTPARNAAAEIERQRETLYQNEKLAALGSLLAGVAHELNNPLSIVIGQALMLGEDLSDGVAGKDAVALANRARQIEVAAERCAKIVRSFLAIARQRKAERRRILVSDLVTAAIDLLGYTLKTSSVTVEPHIDPGLPALLGDADQLHQVIVNLILNAQQALESSSGEKRVTVRAYPDPVRASVVIQVSDTGPGVPDDIRSRIFDPFFTTKPVGIGTGIGLAVSRGMIEGHGGSLTLLPGNGGGATFEILLPVAKGELPETAAPAGAKVNPKQATPVRRRALIVDDEPEIAAMLAEILRHDGFDSALAPTGKAARQLLEQGQAPAFDVVLCDLRMPDEDGMRFYRWLAANQPSLASRVILVTGDTLGPASSRFLAEIDRPVIEKPFTPKDIRQHVAAVLAGLALTA
ncbi:hybrid sensor histidine kinase/response regulator [Dongia rigui]|uniref:histidine kinase n=1 Tax=Dongia rigui TaxID=940149 RepID=A0ABU5E2I0_9PROT|nr:PAS domain S-box protein [Dongia rigui]MDY0873803.1 PAS domain S-box protein [Dongia rigui]